MKKEKWEYKVKASKINSIEIEKVKESLKIGFICSGMTSLIILLLTLAIYFLN